MTLRPAALLCALTVAAAATTVGLAPPAAAATGYNRCPEFRMCVFSGLNGSGAIAYFATADGNLADGVGQRGQHAGQREDQRAEGEQPAAT